MKKLSFFQTIFCIVGLMVLATIVTTLLIFSD